MVHQGVVSHCSRFTNINAGWSGRVHDAGIFQNSVLFKLMEKGKFAPGPRWTLLVLKLVQLFWDALVNEVIHRPLGQKEGTF